MTGDVRAGRDDRQRGDGWLAVTIGLGLFSVGVIALWAFFAGRAERDVTDLIASNQSELLKVGTALKEVHDHTEAMASHWEMSVIRKESARLSGVYDQILMDGSKIREEFEAQDETMRIEDLLSRSRLLQERIQDLAGESQTQAVTLRVARKLTEDAARVVARLQEEFAAIRKVLESGDREKIYATRLELLELGLTQTKSLFTKGIEALMSEEPNGKIISEAAINKIVELQSEARGLREEVEG